MSEHDDRGARYLIRTATGVRGTFTRAQIRCLAAAGKVHPTLRVRDRARQRGVLVAEVLALDAGRPGTGRPRSWLWWLGCAAALMVIALGAAAARGMRSRAAHLAPAILVASSAQEQGEDDATLDGRAAQARFAQQIAPFLATNCSSCHGADKQKAGVRFDLATADPADQQSVALWKRALEQLDSGAMPPEERPRPDPALQSRTAAWMRGQVSLNARLWPEPPLRRLNREEYANAIADLLGLRDDLLDFLPAELGGSEGFTNEADLLSISTRQVEAYLKAASCAAVAVINAGPIEHRTIRIADSDPMRVDPERKGHWDHIPRLLNYVDENGVAIARGDMLIFNRLNTYQSSNAYQFAPVKLTAAGTYRVRLRAIALLCGRSPVRARVTFTDITSMDPWSAGVTSSMRPFVERNVAAGFTDQAAVLAALAKAPADLPPDKIAAVDPALGQMYATANPRLVFENIGLKQVNGWLKNTRPVPKAVQEMAIAQSAVIEGCGHLPAGMIKLVLDADGLGTDRMMFVPGDLELEGPLPPTRLDDALTTALAHQDAAAYARWLAGIMTAAYRRPVDIGEAAGWFGRFRTTAGAARPFADAARVALAAVLCSPEFLTAFEKPRADPRRPRRLDGGELATRLALFLWRGLPDQELMQASTTGLTGQALQAQITRMLAEPKAARFIHEFDDGWLGLRDFDAALPDPKMFPQAQGNHLHESMRREPDEFLAHLLACDGSILELLSGNYVVVNDRLAEYYGLGSGVVGGPDDFRLVRFPDQQELTLGPWSGIGPFAAPDAHAAFATAFAPEHGVDLGASYRDGTLRWQQRPEWTDGAVHDLTGDNSAWYLTRTMQANIAQDATLSLGSDDGIQVWVDGTKVLAKEVYRGIAPDQDQVTIHLEPGEHRLLMKVNNAGGLYSFFFRVVGKMEPQHRGGVLGMAAILIQTSQSTRTSPTRRGSWFLENLLGTKPPPPPANAKAVLAKVEAAATGPLSRRQILELHRHDPTCASCHARFDPLGYALENYGPDGLWRTNELLPIHENGVFKGAVAGSPIDATGNLADLGAFDDINGLKRLLAAKPARFVRAFAKKLLAFAVGRRLGAQDEPSIDTVAAAAAANGYRIRAMLAAVIASDTFQQH